MPRIIPAAVIMAGEVMVGDCETLGDIASVGSSAFANPKSSTFTVPSDRTLMLAGFQIPWMMPARGRPLELCNLLAMARASSTGIGPVAMRSASVGPSTSSMTSAVMPFDRSSP